MNNKLAGEIITFYSYKGGTGRSMALANIACLLARRRDNSGDVLMIDWDLEAPGLHQFFQRRFENPNGRLGDLPQGQLGLIDLFYEIRDRLEKSESEQDVLEDIFAEIDIRKYIVHTGLPSLLLMPAGRFDDGIYSMRVNEFDWADFFDKFPSAITEFAQYLKKKFKYILIDSRTGYNDISGICTSIMPEKLVTVFTPNRQNLSGIVELIRRATEYRKQSDDLRPLMIFPLPSRIEDAEKKLREEWRSGNSKGVDGYQIQLEAVLKDVYNLQECDLTDYFDKYKLRYVPIYSYGEEIAVLSERSEDQFSLAHSFENFTTRIVGNENAWEEVYPALYDFDRMPEPENFNLPEPIRRAILQTGTFALIAVFVIATYFIILPLIPSQQFFYDFFHWEYFGIVVGIFVAIDFLWVRRWGALLQRINKLLAKPWIFEKDKEPYEPPLYPRELLEALAKSVKPESKPKTKLKIDREPRDRTVSEYIRGFVFNKEKPIRALGYVISLALFVFFLIVDASVVMTTFVDIGLISPNLPPILQRFETVILGGTIISAVVGVWMFVEMSGRGELVNTDSLSKSQKKIFKLFAATTTFFAAILMIALAIQRLISLGFLQPSPTFELILSFVLYGLLPINNTLSAVLTFQPAASGLIVVIYLLFMLIIGILPVLVFLADVVWRGAYILLDVTLWALFTPIIAIPYGISKTIDSIS